MKNKKVKNTKTTAINGINFKSTLEAVVYRTLLEKGIIPEYEKHTYELSPKVRPSVAFYNRIRKKLTLDGAPIRPITYTPDFVFKHNDILIIIEVKGFENDTFPIKKNLFRKVLEKKKIPVMYFEIRSKKELLECLNIVNMVTSKILNVKRLIVSLPEKDIPIANRLYEKRDWESLKELVSSAIVKIEKKLEKGTLQYKDVDLDSLYTLITNITEIIDE